MSVKTKTVKITRRARRGGRGVAVVKTSSERERILRRLREEYSDSECARTLQVNEAIPIHGPP